MQLVTTLRAEEITQLLNVFSGRYPFIRGTAVRGGSERNFARVEQEALAGKLSSDLWHINATFFSLALRKRLIASYLSPESAVYAGRFRRKDGNFVASKSASVCLDTTVASFGSGSAQELSGSS